MTDSIAIRRVIDGMFDLGFDGDAESWTATFRDSHPLDLPIILADAQIELRAMRAHIEEQERKTQNA